LELSSSITDGELVVNMKVSEISKTVGTVERIASSLQKWIKSSRITKRTVAVELKENIELIRLYVESGADIKKLVPELKDTAYRKALSEGFDFNSFNKDSFDQRTTQKIKQLARYHDWNTQKVFENVYEKIVTLKKSLLISNPKKKVNINLRVKNLFKLMVILAIHIGN